MDDYTLIEKNLITDLERQKENLSGLIADIRSIQQCRQVQVSHLQRVYDAAVRFVHDTSEENFDSLLDAIELI